MSRRRGQAPQQSPKRERFSPPKFLLKLTIVYIAFLAAGNEVADYSQLVSDLRDGIKADKWAVFQAYAAWILALSAARLIRFRLQRDLQALRAERLSGGGRR